MNNPFAILSVDKGASKKEILQQAAVVLRTQKQYDARMVAEAQKALFSIPARAEAEFRHCLDLDFIKTSEPDGPQDDAVPELSLLEFSDEKGAIER